MSDTVYTFTHGSIDYTSSFVTASPTERCRIFYPTTEGGAADFGWSSGQWPFVIWVVNSGFVDGNLPATIPPTSWLHPILDNGFALVVASTSQSRDEIAGGDKGAGTYRPPHIVGAGNDYDQWDDPTYPNTCKSGVHLVQWGYTDAASFNLDTASFAIGGRSGGSWAPLFVGHGLDWSTYPGSDGIAGEGQFRVGVSSRPPAICPMQIIASFGPLEDTKSIPLLPDRLFPASPDARTAKQKQDALGQLVTFASPMWFAFNEGVNGYPGVQALTSTMPTFLIATGTVGFQDFTLDAAGMPNLPANSITQSHDGWHLAIYWQRMLELGSAFHLQNSQLAWLENTDPGNTVAPGRVTYPELPDIFTGLTQWLTTTLGLSTPTAVAQSRPIRAVGPNLQVFQANEAVAVSAGGTGAVTASDALTSLGGVSSIFFQTPYEILEGTTFQGDRQRTYEVTLTEDTQLDVENGKDGVDVVLRVTGAHKLKLPAGTTITGSYDDTTPGAYSVIRFRILEDTEPFYHAWIQTYYEPQVGLVFRQTLGNQFADEAAALSTPSGDPAAADLYSRLIDLENFRHPDTGQFHFRYVVSTPASTREWRFYQDSNPLDTYQVVEGYELDQLINGFNDTSMGGLCRSGFAGQVLDGQPGVGVSIGSTAGVFGSVGVLESMVDTTYLPGDFGVSSAEYVELYVI